MLHCGVPILDQFGKPIQPTRTPVDAPAVTYVRPGDRQVAPGIDPVRLASVLRAANEGDIQDYLVLADEMEERDPHYYSLLQTRKLTVAGGKPELTGSTDTIRQAVQAELLEAPWFGPLLVDLLDSLSKGFAVVQPEWILNAKRWDYECFHYVDPRCFTFDYLTQREIRLRTPGEAFGIPLPPGQFVVHFAGLRSTVPSRSGLARLSAVTWMFKTYTVNDWVTFAEVYGMPLRIGKYDPATATESDLRALRSAIARLGHDAAAILPTGMEIDVDALGSRAGGSADVFLGLAEYFDKQLSKAILGQTMTSDDGSSLAQAEVHERTGNRIFLSDAARLASRVTDSVIRPWVQFNFGESVEVPRLSLNLTPPDNLKEFSEAVTPLIDRGLKVSIAQLRQKTGLVEPLSEEDTLEGKPEPPAPVIAAPGAKPAVKPEPNATTVSANSVTEAERIAEEEAAQWVAVMGPYKETLEDIAAENTDYQSFLLALNKHFATRVDSNPLLKRLAVSMAKLHSLAQSDQDKA